MMHDGSPISLLHPRRDLACISAVAIAIAVASCAGGDRDLSHEVIEQEPSTGSAERESVCGDGVIDRSEACDDGNDIDSDECTNACALPACGDGIVGPGEACDDGNTFETDACTSTCQLPACDDDLRDGGETDIDCGGPDCARCDVGRSCATGADCATGLCAAATCAIPPSCQEIKTSDPKAHDGIYTIDPNGGGVPIQVFCDMTTDGGGWTMVFKLSAGVDADPAQLWKGPPLNENDPSILEPGRADRHYVSRYISHFWNDHGSTVLQARVHVYKDSQVAKFWKFSAKDSVSTDWFNPLQLIDSSYADLPQGPFNYFSIEGQAVNGRTFFINRNYGGCSNDNGWLVVKHNQSSTPCAWDKNNGAPPISILYSLNPTYTTWQSSIDNLTIGVADTLAVLIR